MYTGKRHYWFYDWKNSFIVVEVLEKLLDIYPNKDIYIIWDGWSAHTSNYTQAFVDLHSRIKILPLPIKASWLNPVERDFSMIQRFALNNSDCQSVREMMDMIGTYIEKELCSS